MGTSYHAPLPSPLIETSCHDIYLRDDYINLTSLTETQEYETMLEYLPLNPANHEIRLVRLRLPEAEHVVGDDTDPDAVSLDLQHVSMNDGIPYGAVSYVWGSSLASDLIKISVNGQSHYIGENLHAALTEFRRQKVTDWLWIDAICIHQSDNEEKSWHVDRMRDVFREAESVHIWLGPGRVGSDIAMDFISRYGPRAVRCGAIDLRRETWFGGENDAVMRYLEQVKAQTQKAPETDSSDEAGPFTATTVELAELVYDFIHEPAWRKSHEGQRTFAPDHLITGMRDLLRRDYWHRVWVIQEVTLARRGQVYCGTKTVSLDELDAVWTTLFFCVQREPDELFPECHNIRGAFPGGLYPNKAITMRLKHQFPRQEQPIKLIDILLNWGFAPHRYIYTASDPRDLVYGLLGVLPQTEKLGIHADYSMTAGKVLAQFTKAVLLSKDSRGGLSLNHSFPKREEIPDCPTWVPDWVTIGKYGCTPFPFNSGWDKYEAGGKLLQSPSPENDTLQEPMTLRRAGCRVAVVTEVMKPPEWLKPSEWTWDWSIKDHEKWLRDVKEFAGLGDETGPAEDYVWRTLAQKRKDCDPVGDGVNQWRDEHNHIVRKIMRREPIDPDKLSETEADFFRKGPYSFYLNAWGIDRMEDLVDRLMHQWVKKMLPREERTLFKTNKGMFAIGHTSVRPGDIVAIIWEVASPMVLRPRGEGGFTVQGDAYVDGIMHGEFLDTNPAHEEFVLY